MTQLEVTPQNVKQPKNGRNSGHVRNSGDYGIQGGVLKVVGNEKNGGSRRTQMLGNGIGPWRSRFIYNLNMQFLIKILFPFPLVTAKLKGDYLILGLIGQC